LKKEIGVDDEILQPYFPLKHVVSAVLGIFQEVLGVRFKRLSGPSNESKALTWHPDVDLFEVTDAGKLYSSTAMDSFVFCCTLNTAHLHNSQIMIIATTEIGKVIGHFYLDLFSRDGKYGHQCVVPIRPSFVSDNGNFVTPVCAILGNMTKGDEKSPSLLLFSEVATFFHEFGHGLFLSHSFSLSLAPISIHFFS
jgi:Zn-dependent oligopeptidase